MKGLPAAIPALVLALALLLTGCGIAIPNPLAEPTPVIRRQASPTPTRTPTVPPTATPRVTPTVRLSPSVTPVATTTPLPYVGELARDNGWEITVADVKRFKALNGGSARGIYWIVLFKAHNATGGPRRLDLTDFNLVGGGKTIAASAEGTDRAVKVYRRHPLSAAIAADATVDSVVVFDADEQVTGLWLRLFSPMVIALQPPPPPPPPTVAPNRPSGAPGPIGNGTPRGTPVPAGGQ